MQNIDNKLYGHIISRDQIIRETSDVRKTDLTDMGAYVYIENRGSELRIYQDYSGFLNEVLHDKQETVPQRLWRSVKNRLAIKKAGQDN